MKNITRKKAHVLFGGEADLGEGPLWLDSSKELLWVDINKGIVQSLNIRYDEFKTIYHGEKPSCLLPLNTGDFLIADKNKLVQFNTASGSTDTFLDFKFSSENIRFNDGKVDPNGNIWVGTMDMNVSPNKGNVYKVDSEKNIEEVINGVTISNGLAWSLDQKTMYYIDTAESEIIAYDFNQKSEIANKRVLIKVPVELGYPDGMTIDARGNLWVAMWGGHAVICWNPVTAEILKIIEVEAPNVTSCTFGGIRLDALLITTAREGLSKKDLLKYPKSGNVFYVKLGAKGVKADSYKTIL